MENYFEFYEFIKSDVAEKNKVNNIPTFAVIENIKLMLPLLNELRKEWGSAIVISSGFRCDKLNKLVGGVDTSLHKKGLAVDIIPKNGEIDKFIEFCKNFFKNRRDYDQCITEKSGNTKWVHIGLYDNRGVQRHQLFNIEK